MEAYVNKKSIKIQTVNEKGMVKTAHLLQEMGIHSRCYSYNQRKKNCSRVHILFINRREDKETFSKKVGFFHEKKTKLLEESLGL
ncbi:LAGLIDADG family homing endonuclease [Candidatus Woesearchaeota archaeon]|nr:LAGLIDADG family homing endonuclease [Candidatus Woesearchaeota archaeon]HIH38256.1 hypothetical protein [Candidatus Woesearchaeota archaeon]HIH49170.1 hypothetical protein [Candidatus Woesearchaeota archaeon]HIJ04412.1 hypothetical protein [Candidatus Woesearchaeota archaeon]